MSEAAAHEHPSDLQYVKIALFLGVLTAAEVATYFVESDPYKSEIKPLWIGGLLVMMCIKFAVVAGYFMHLKFDHPMFRRLFVTGLVLALVVYAIVFFAFAYWYPSYERGDVAALGSLLL